MEVDHFIEDKFGGAMEFGGCMTNSALKFIDVKDIDGSIIRVPYKSKDEPLENFRRYYMETSRVATNMKGKVFYFKCEATNTFFYPDDKYTIYSLARGNVVITPIFCLPRELQFINNYVIIKMVNSYIGELEVQIK